MHSCKFCLAAAAALFTAFTHAQEIGADFRVSTMGDDAEADITVRDDFAGQSPAVAYNSTGDEYLVVWFGDDASGALVEGENEIWAQRVDAGTGALLGDRIRVSDMGVDGDDAFGAVNPAVAYNSTDNQYLVVWAGDDDFDQAFEIYGQRINAATGAEVGANDFRISDMGANDNDAGFGAANPDVAYHSIENAYLVVWNGDDDTGALVDGENEIYGQYVSATGAEFGDNDFRISDAGDDGDPTFGAFLPSVALSVTSDEFLVVWQADDGGVDNANEIYGQRIFCTVGTEIGTNDFRISDMGANDSNTNFVASSPAVAWNAALNQFLVVWNGDDNSGGLVDGDFEIFGQRIEAGTGTPLGTNDFRISDMGPNGNTSFGAFNPEVAANPDDAEFLVVWQADDSAPLINDENEIFAQRIRIDGAETGDNDVRVSDMGPNGNADYDAGVPAVAYSATSGSWIVVWSGDDNTPPLVEGENEVFGQLLEAANTVWVDFNFTGAESGSFANPFNTLAEGVAAANPGGTVTIVESTTSETLTINTPVTITSIGVATIGQF